MEPGKIEDFHIQFKIGGSPTGETFQLSNCSSYLQSMWADGEGSVWAC